MLRDLSRLAKSTDFLKQVVVPERERERERMGKQALGRKWSAVRKIQEKK
jgi:hypothetical protein